MTLAIGALSQADLDWAHALNQLHAVELSSLSRDGFATLVSKATHAVAVADQAAFLLAFDQDADYDSPNFLWFKARYPKFLYVDRIAVATSHRRLGLARRLYDDLFATARAIGHEIIVCEVNASPPNPSSDAFHKSLGFEAVGQESLEGSDKTVNYLCCRVS